MLFFSTKNSTPFLVFTVGIFMKELDMANIILRLLTGAGKAGLHCLELKRLSGLTEENFKLESTRLWGQGRLTGVREDRCCGRGCAFMCVSYMAEDRIWRLIETGLCHYEEEIAT
ncbi:hypothetical protein AB6D78_08510 [Vibrio splendidus]